METKSKTYTEAQIDLLIGQLKGSRYVSDVQKVLIREGYSYTDSYVQRVFGKFSYSEAIWDAIKEVALDRQRKKEANAQLANQFGVEVEMAA